MSETLAPVESSPSANADKAAKARATLRELRAFLGWGAYTSNNRFADCCGSGVVNNEGKVKIWKELPAVGPTDIELCKTFIRQKYSKQSTFGRSASASDQEYERYVEELAKKYCIGNQTGVTLGIGITKDALISACYTPDNILYGKVEGLEFHDADDGLVSLIWTNA